MQMASPTSPSAAQLGPKKGVTFSVSKPTPPTASETPGTFRYSPTISKTCVGLARKEKKTINKFTPSVFLTPSIAPQRRRSDQDCTPTSGHSGSKAGGIGKRNSIRPLRASPLFSESPFIGIGQFSASKTCQALVQSPCRSENFRRQRRRLYHQDEFDDVKRKLSLPDSAGGSSVFRTPKLGKGGFGSVYIGKYGGKLVAIKQLHNKGQGKIGQGESLCAELNAFRLHHANIVKVLTFTCTGPFLQIVFEYVGRRNLQQLLDDTCERFVPNQRVEYCQQVADALQFCHSNRVLHLDVKPANILVTDDSRCCKLGDFGCSRIMATSTKTSETTPSCTSASTPGTLIYKAPELLRGSIASPKADVYSFGFVMWQCATRQSPYEGISMHTIVFCVVARNLRPTLNMEAMDKLSDEERMLIDTAHRCWKPAPDFRPEISELHEALQDYYTTHIV